MSDSTDDSLEFKPIEVVYTDDYTCGGETPNCIDCGCSTDNLFSFRLENTHVKWFYGDFHGFNTSNYCTSCAEKRKYLINHMVQIFNK